MIDLQSKLPTEVVKRNGRKVEFDSSKIAIAIKKGFENIYTLNEIDEEKRVYTEKDVNKVYHGVIKRIEQEYNEQEKIKIEDIQDLIENELDRMGYKDVRESFSDYR